MIDTIALGIDTIDTDALKQTLKGIELMKDHHHSKRKDGFQLLLAKSSKELDKIQDLLRKEALKINSEYAIDRIKASKFMLLLVLKGQYDVKEMVEGLRAQVVKVVLDYTNSLRGYPMHGYLLVILELMDWDFYRNLVFSMNLSREIMDIIQECIYYFSQSKSSLGTIDLHGVIMSNVMIESSQREEFRTISNHEKIKNAFWRSLKTCLKILEHLSSQISRKQVKQVVDLVIKVLLTVIHSGVVKEAQETLKFLIKLENQECIKDRINLFLKEIRYLQDGFRRFDIKSDGIARVFLVLLQSLGSSQERNHFIQKIMELFQENSKSRDLVLQLTTFLVLHSTYQDLPIQEILEFSLKTLKEYEEYKFSGTLYQLVLKTLKVFLKSQSCECLCKTFKQEQISEILKTHDENQPLSIILLQFICTTPRHACLFQDLISEIRKSNSYHLRQSSCKALSHLLGKEELQILEKTTINRMLESLLLLE